MSRVLIIGDIHGNYQALLQVLERCNFDNDKDTLISLGDVVDGHSESFEVVEELLKIKNLIPIRGNHDDWFFQWLKTGINPSNWQQGQKATGLSYLKHYDPEMEWLGTSTGWMVSLRPNHIPIEHVEFFRKQLPYYKDDKNNLFIHGGFNRHELLDHHLEYMFYWDRDLWSQALSWESMSPVKLKDDSKPYKPKFKIKEEVNEIFIGHTSTEFWGKQVPMKAANIHNLDTGAGWFGKLTIMDLDTKEYWQSDSGKELYPDFKDR